MQVTYGALRQRSLRDFIWRHPECWTVAFSATVWLALVVRATVHVHSPSALAAWIHWLMMVAAMMLPLNMDALRYAAQRSLWSRRNRAMFGYLLGYGGVWALAGLPLAWAFAAARLPERIDWAVGASLGFLVAALWLISPWNILAASLCHWTIPLAPRGWPADRDCLRYGWISGLYCVFKCWPFMLVCWLSSHSVLVMACGFMFGWTERYGKPNYRLHSLLLAGLALGFAVWALAV
ncbi:MAG: DUF2182 domain-containing protein [Bryobacteraceae bacterium]